MKTQLALDDLRVRPAHSASAKRRIEWIDIARGIGITLVVFQHVLRGVVHAGEFSMTPPWRVEDFFVHTSHMPVFFFLAGLHVESSLAKGKKRFLQSKLWTILYPYFLWSLLQGGIQIALSRHVNNPLTTSDLLGIPWHPLDQFWFLYSLMLCHLLAIMLLPKFRRLLLPAAIAGFVLSLTVSLPGFIIRQSLFMSLFYLLGIAIGDRVKQPITLSALGKTASFCGVCLLFGIAAYAAFRHGNPYWDSLGTLPANLLGIAVIVWIAKELHGKLASVLTILGRGSMAIYVMHVIAAAGTRIGLKALHLHQAVAYLIFATLAGLTIPLLAEELFRRCHLLVPLGLSPLPVVKKETPKVAVAA